MIDKTKYVEFIAKRNNVQIEGFVNLAEIDDEAPVQFYNHQGFENGYNIPTNLYNQDTEMEECVDYENLVTYWIQDDIFLQIIWDFQNEYHKTQRPGYTLVINPELQK